MKSQNFNVKGTTLDGILEKPVASKSGACFPVYLTRVQPHFAKPRRGQQKGMYESKSGKNLNRNTLSKNRSAGKGDEIERNKILISQK